MSDTEAVTCGADHPLLPPTAWAGTYAVVAGPKCEPGQAQQEVAPPDRDDRTLHAGLRVLELVGTYAAAAR